MDEILGIHMPSPRASFEIREVHVSQALRKDPLPGIPYSFNPYVGCYHGCAFCYVPRLLQVERGAWGTTVVVKRNAATVLAREVRRLPRGLVAISTATDPYQYVEGKYRITRRALEVLLRADWPLSVLSRSPLMLRDVDLFIRFRELEVGMSVPTLDDRARCLLEPWAPPVQARLRCLRELAAAGLKTFVGFAPAYPPTDGWTPARIAETLVRHGVQKVFVRLLDTRWGARESVRQALDGSPLAGELMRMADRDYMGSFVEGLAEECLARGIEFRDGDDFRHGGERYFGLLGGVNGGSAVGGGVGMVGAAGRGMPAKVGRAVSWRPPSRPSQHRLDLYR
jgi:DNA repair photolyase